MSLRLLVALVLVPFVAGCDTTGNALTTPLPDRPGLAVAQSDARAAVSFSRLTDALRAAPPVSVVAEVDHRENAVSVGLDLRPTRVVLFGNPALGTPLMQINQQAGLDLPQKMLVYEGPGGRTVVAYNTAEYLARRHGVGGAATLDQIAGALGTFAKTAAGRTARSTAGSSSVSRDEGVVTVESANDFGTTYARLLASITGNPNLSVVAELDHAENAASVGLTLRPTRLVVFGNPALGTQLMQSEQTVGIDLPQKVLVYQNASGRVFVAYNAPTYIADRHDLDGVTDVTGTIATALANLVRVATSAGNG